MNLVEKQKEAEKKGRKFIRYKEGAELYGMSLSKFQRMAKDSGAIYKVNRMVLVNREVFDEYLESFRLESM